MCVSATATNSEPDLQVPGAAGGAAESARGVTRPPSGLHQVRVTPTACYIRFCISDLACYSLHTLIEHIVFPHCVFLIKGYQE